MHRYGYNGKVKFFRCRSCGGNFKEDYQILYGKHGIEICEYCWDEVNMGIRKIEEPNPKGEQQ